MEVSSFNLKISLISDLISTFVSSSGLFLLLVAVNYFCDIVNLLALMKTFKQFFTTS